MTDSEKDNNSSINMSLRILNKVNSTSTKSFKNLQLGQESNDESDDNGNYKILLQPKSKFLNDTDNDDKIILAENLKPNDKNEGENENDGDQVTHIPRSMVKSVTSKINSNKIKQLQFLKRQKTVNFKFNDPSKIEKLTHMTENDIPIVVRKKYTNNTSSSSTVIKEEPNENRDNDYSSDSDFLSDDDNDKPTEEIILKNRSIKVKPKTIKKMTLVFKKTTSTLNKKLTTNLVSNLEITSNLEKIKGFMTSQLKNPDNTSEVSSLNNINTKNDQQIIVSSLSNKTGNTNNTVSTSNFRPDNNFLIFSNKKERKLTYNNNDNDINEDDEDSYNHNSQNKKASFNSKIKVIGNDDGDSNDENKITIDQNLEMINDKNNFFTENRRKTDSAYSDSSGKVNSPIFNFKANSNASSRKEFAYKNNNNSNNNNLEYVQVDLSVDVNGKYKMESETKLHKNDEDNIAHINSKEQIKDFVEEQDSILLQNLINQYYFDISENFSGNYEEYVVNNLTIVSFLNKLMTYKHAYCNDYNENSIIDSSNSFISKAKNRVSGLTPPKLSKEDQEKVNKLDPNKKILFLDLDETLIHSDLNSKYESSDAIISLKLEDESESSFSILIRPYTNEFLQYTSENFNLVLFTAGIKSYADAIVDYLDPENKYFSLRLYRDSCINFNNFFIKDLSIINSFDLKDMIIIDNCIFSFAINLKNGILIPSYYFDINDKELLNVTDFLEDKLLKTNDVREVNEGFFGFETIRNFLYDKLIKEGIIS